MEVATRKHTLLLGLDLGTSAIKGVVVSLDGKIIAHDKVAATLERPQPRHVEFPAPAYYRTVCKLIRSLNSKIPRTSSIQAMAMAAASGNTLLVDKKGRPLIKVISWLDSRVPCDELRLLHKIDKNKLYRTVGWPLVDGFPLVHLAWLKHAKPDMYRQADHKCMNTDYLLYQFTDKWGMDYSTATTFYLQDQVKRSWHQPFLSLLQIPETALSPLDPSGTVLGTLTAKAARDTGLKNDTKVVLGAFDHPCAARGTGTLAFGDFLLSCGTSWVGFFPINDRNKALKLDLLIDPFLTPAGPWGALFSLPQIGLTIDAAIEYAILVSQKKIPLSNKYNFFNKEASLAPRGAHGLILNILQSPVDIRRTLSTIDRKYTPADICRAVMESVAGEIQKKMAMLLRMGITIKNITMVGGPAESPLWPRIVAEVTGLTVKLTNGQHAGALGAAILAGMGAGFFSDEIEGFSRIGGTTRIIAPSKKAHKTYGLFFNKIKG